jgi:hypothetical protein
LRLLTTALSLLWLAETPLQPKLLDGPAIIAAFEGQTVRGAYADGLAFAETYHQGGAIDYWDPRLTSTGEWSVINNLFCTFYTSMSGACFSITQIGDNCFDFHAAAETKDMAQEPNNTPTYTARGSVKGKPSTCPEELQA